MVLSSKLVYLLDQSLYPRLVLKDLFAVVLHELILFVFDLLKSPHLP